MNNIRSRSPRRTNKTSLARSLSNEQISFPSQRSSDRSIRDSYNKDKHHCSRHAERIHNTEYNRSLPKYHKHEKFDQKKNDKKIKEEPYSPNSFKKVVSTSPIKDISESNDTYIEDSMQDPSTCNFESGFYHTAADDSLMERSDSKRMDERNVKDETNSRLERLEKLVELLVSNKLPTVHSNVHQDSRPSEIDMYELIPRNSKFTTSMWLNKIDDECIKRNFDEKTCIEFIETKMTGIIKAWYKTLLTYDFTWPELKMLIIETFPDNIDFARTLKLLVERSFRPNETIAQYYFSKMYLLEACKISAENAVSCLLDGLQNQQLKEEGKFYNFLTPEALFSQFLSKLPEFPHDNKFMKTNTHEIPTYKEIHVTQSYERPKLQTNSRDTFKQNIVKCFTCNKYGHIDVNCRHAPICYNCKRTGHIALNCPFVD